MEEKLAEARKVTARNSSDLEANYEICHVLVQQGKYREAIDELTDNLNAFDRAGVSHGERGKRLATVLDKLGDAYLGLKDYGNALTCYARTLALDPNHKGTAEKFIETRDISNKSNNSSL